MQRGDSGHRQRGRELEQIGRPRQRQTRQFLEPADPLGDRVGVQVQRVRSGAPVQAVIEKHTGSEQ